MKGSGKYGTLGTNLTRVFNNSSASYLQEIFHPTSTTYLNFGTPSEALAQAGQTHAYSLEPLIYPAIYLALVIVFTYFYTSVMFNAKEIAENLQKQGGFIADIRPGHNTEVYLTKVVNRLTLFGSISLGLLAVMPIAAQVWLKTDQIAIGGTSILILVSVSLETLRQIESKSLMVTYDDYSEIGIGQGSSDDGVEGKKPKRKFTFLKKKAKTA
jgi:preprotein translocase subunit SecY